MGSKHFLYRLYSVVMSVLAIISVVLIVIDYAHKIDITKPPYSYWDNGILIIFVIDYFTRLLLAKNKWKFIKTNIFDLLSIIPVSSVFYFFRIARISRAFRIIKLLRIFRLVGLAGKVEKFLRMNGLIYYLYFSLAILLIGASLYSISEKVTFPNALWWAITTATTVGYGDISPSTLIGKLAAVLIMLLGIGFIGVLTSNIMSLFSKDEEDETIKQIQELKKENHRLEVKLDKIMELLEKEK